MKKRSAPCRCSVIRSTQLLTGPAVFNHLSNLSISAWENCIPHLTPPELLLQWFALVRSSLSSHIQYKLDPVLALPGFCSRKRNRCMISPWWIWEAAYGKENNRAGIRNEKVRAGRVAADRNMLTFSSHICIKRPDTSGVISRRTQKPKITIAGSSRTAAVVWFHLLYTIKHYTSKDVEISPFILLLKYVL